MNKQPVYLEDQMHLYLQFVLVLLLVPCRRLSRADLGSRAHLFVLENLVNLVDQRDPINDYF